MWLPDDIEECPVCHVKPARKRTTMEWIFIAILSIAILLLVLAVIMPGSMFRFIQAIDIEFVEITNGSNALMIKLGIGNDSASLFEWKRNLSETIAENVNSTPVMKIVESRTKQGEYLSNIDALANYVTRNIRYKKSKDFIEMTDIIRTFSGDDRSHAIFLASLFSESQIDFRIDVVEEKTKSGRGYHYRILVRTTKSEEEVRKIVVKRIRKRRSGMFGTKAKVWYIQDGEFRWYVIDTTGQTIKQKEAFADISWIFIGASHNYYANRSHYSFDISLD